MSEKRAINDEFGTLTQYQSSRGSWRNWSRKYNDVEFMLHEGRRTIDYLLAFKAAGIKFKLNDMTDRLEICGELDLLPDAPEPMSDIHESVVLNWLRDVGLVGRERMIDAMSQAAAMNRYHPVVEYFKSLEWDGVDHFAKLMSFIKFSDDTDIFAQLAFKRFLIGAVAKIMVKGQNFMLVIDGRQGIGKSYFARWLCPLPTFFIEGAVHTDDKDSYKRLISTFIWEVGELEGTTRKADRAALKDFITRVEVTIRVPYGRHDIVKPASASLIGTINEDGAGFLNDPTGSRRFAVVKIDAIDFDYVNHVDVHQLWAQIYTLYQTGESWVLNRNEAEVQTAINELYESDSPVAEHLHRMYRIDPDVKEHTPSIEILETLKAAGLNGLDRANLMEISTQLRRVGVQKKRVGGVMGFYGLARKNF